MSIKKGCRNIIKLFLLGVCVCVCACVSVVPARSCAHARGTALSPRAVQTVRDTQPHVAGGCSTTCIHLCDTRSSSTDRVRSVHNRDPGTAPARETANTETENKQPCRRKESTSAAGGVAGAERCTLLAVLHPASHRGTDGINESVCQESQVTELYVCFPPQEGKFL